jgi:anti-sigma regulatory factor (Ser/Thr protein kinase)
MEGAADVASLPAMIGFVLGSAESAGVPEPEFGKLELVLEEILMNVIRHGYAPWDPGRIALSCSPAEPGRIRVEVRDWGRPFDPLAADPPDLTVSLEERQIGGLGIFLTLELSDECVYQRLNGHNLFAFSFPRAR